MMRLSSKVAELKSLATSALNKRTVSKNRHYVVRRYCSKPPPSMKDEFKVPEKSGGMGGLLLKLLGFTMVSVGGGTAYCLYDESARKLVQNNVPYSSCYFATIESLTKSQTQSETNKTSKIILPPVVQKYVPKEESKDIVSTTNSMAKIVEPEIDVPKREVRKEVDSELNEAMKVVLSNIENDIHETLAHLRVSLQQASAATSDALHKKLEQVSEMDYSNINKAIESANDFADVAKKQLEQLNKAIHDAIPSITKSTLNEYLSNHNATVKEVEALVLQIEESMHLKGKIEQSEAEKPDIDIPPQDTSTDESSRSAEDLMEYLEMIDPIIVNEPLSTIATEAPAPAAPSDSHPAQVVDDACGGCDSDCSSSSSTLADELVDDDVVTHLKTEADLMNEAMADMKLQYEQHLSKKLDEERSRLHDNYQSAITRKENEYRLMLEDEIQTNNIRMTSSHHEHLNMKLTQKDEELAAKLAEVVAEERKQERREMRYELAIWIAKMAGIEEGLNSRADAEFKAKKSQELWLACQALLTSVEIGIITEHCDIGVPKPLASEVKAVLNAGNGHPLVTEVTSQFGANALTNGVSSTAELNERFKTVYRLSRRFALVDEANCSLLRYALSYVQSGLVLRRPLLANENAKDLDTFQLVDSAAQSMENGDLVQALKYMNQLKGTSREVASDWISDARLHLETKSAVEALISYASASGLSALF